MFIKEDLYTTIGSQKLYHCWTDKVTKFDSSSFYNWEQDNLPVYDLDERTYYLWEKMGYPTSSIPGVALVVSADAPDSAVACNKNIFKTVSAAIDALPNVINFPVVIEIASFGNLGDLILDNYKFGPRGSIEIINRNFANGYADGYLQNLGIWNPILMSRSSADGNNPYYHGSAFSTNYGVFKDTGSGGLINGLLETFAIRTHFAMASALSISSLVFSGNLGPGNTNDVRLVQNLNGFVSRSKALNSGSIWQINFPSINTTTHNSRYSKSDLIIASRNTIHPFSGAGAASLTYHDNIYYKSYDLNPEAYENLGIYDASTIDDLNSNENLFFADESLGLNGVNGLFYGNRLTKLIVNNCDGPIYIRNFFLDGSGANLKNNNYGVEINNCKNIFIENLVSTRYRKAGFIFNNSNVVLLRGCVATRNYDFDSSNNRITGPWATRRITDSLNTTSGIPYLDYGAGLVANNTNITISSTRTIEELLVSSYSYNRTLQNNGSTGYAFSSAFTKNYIFEFSKNANGIILNNSQLISDELFKQNQTDHYAWTMNLDIFDNVQDGMSLINSKLSFNGRTHFVGNLIGLRLNSSVFEIDKASFIYNQKIGLIANNSTVLYGKNLLPYVNNGNPTETNSPTYFNKNGKHLVLENSKFTPLFTSSMDKIYDLISFLNPIGTKMPGQKDITPGVEITNNSNAILVSPYETRDEFHSVDNNSAKACKGAAISVTNNSKATLIGTQHGATRISGPKGRERHKNLAAVFAGNNSTVELNGPTVIGNYGVNLLAENNSVINIQPQRNEGEGTLDVSSFNLSNVLNHTAVELHSTRACIVVDNHSQLTARDLGSYKYNWEFTGSYYSTDSSKQFNYNIDNIETYVSGGSLQFYPNPIFPYGVTSYNSTTFPGQASATMSSRAFSLAANNRNLRYFVDTDTAFNDFSGTTTGGMCVRALNDSLVNITNVNFPCGWWNASGPYYDNTITPDLGGLCYRLYIWNIADNSQLKASYASVKGVHPKAAGYTGPLGVWTSGAGVVLSGLPSTTPDTSSTSILDYFGIAATSANPFGRSTATNYGPFRLYFSIDPVVNSLSSILDSNNDYTNYIPQIYSQGYQPSGNMQCLTSSIHSFALKRISGGSIAASGYYYGNEVMDKDGYVRVFLDESSAEIFANAKHCATGKSNNAKLVSIYYPFENATYGSFYNDTGIKSVNFFDIQRDN